MVALDGRWSDDAEKSAFSVYQTETVMLSHVLIIGFNRWSPQNVFCLQESQFICDKGVST